MCQYGHKTKIQVVVDWASNLDGKATISGQVAWMEKSQSVCQFWQLLITLCLFGSERGTVKRKSSECGTNNYEKNNFSVVTRENK
jgi:hypothetical protein